MDLFEYQARDLLVAYDVPVVRGIVAHSPEDVRAAALKLGTDPVVVKAQVKTGDRAKAGGIRIIYGPRADEAAGAAAERILGMEIDGQTVRSVMVTEGVEIATEYYVAITLDRTNRYYVAMLSTQGGTGIEQLAQERPEAVRRFPINPLHGLDETFADQIVDTVGFPAEQCETISDILVRLWDLVAREDATLVEINPLVVSEDDELLALDAKVVIDGNAAFRQPGHVQLVDDIIAADPLEAEARAKKLSYIRLSGSVGIISNGAALAMSTLDAVDMAGRDWEIKSANFLNLGGSAPADYVATALDLVMSDPNVTVVLVNVFGGMTTCDQVASGILSSLDTAGAAAKKPLVVRLDGNNAKAGCQALRDAAHPLITQVETMDAAARLAVQLAAGSPAS
jgi:succinyl-CoA synthetase beta subunit